MNNLKWKLFKWFVVKHIKRIAKLHGLEGAVYPYLIGLEFNFKEAIFNQWGFFQSFRFAFDLELQEFLKDSWFSAQARKYLLPNDKQLVLDDEILLVDGKYNDLIVGNDGWLQKSGGRTEYYFNFKHKSLYYKGTKIGTLEKVKADVGYWTFIHI